MYGFTHGLSGENMSTAIRVQRQCVIPVLPLITQCVIPPYNTDNVLSGIPLVHITIY